MIHGLQLPRRDFLAILSSALATSRAIGAGPVKIGMVPDAGATQVSIEQKAPTPRLSVQSARPTPSV